MNDFAKWKDLETETILFPCECVNIDSYVYRYISYFTYSKDV